MRKPASASGSTAAFARKTQKLVVIFAAVTDQVELVPQPEEIAAAFWLPVEEARSRLTYDRDRKILRDAFAHVCARSQGRPRPAKPASGK